MTLTAIAQIVITADVTILAGACVYFVGRVVRTDKEHLERMRSLEARLEKERAAFMRKVHGEPGSDA